MDATSELFDPIRREFHRARYEFATHHVYAKDVADIACGTGYGSVILKDAGSAMSVTGIDIDAAAINYATRRYGTTQIKFLAAPGDATTLAAQSLDAVVSFETIEHVPDDKRLIEEFVRLLRPGGTLICSTPNQWPLEIAPYHIRVYDHDGFRSLLSTYFQEVKIFNQNSGSNWEFNRKQPAGIVETTPDNQELAECYIAVASGMKPTTQWTYSANG